MVIPKLWEYKYVLMIWTFIKNVRNGWVLLEELKRASITNLLRCHAASAPMFARLWYNCRAGSDGPTIRGLHACYIFATCPSFFVFFFFLMVSQNCSVNGRKKGWEGDRRWRWGCRRREGRTRTGSRRTGINGIARTRGPSTGTRSTKPSPHSSISTSAAPTASSSSAAATQVGLVFLGFCLHPFFLFDITLIFVN